jgi:3-hydroxyisobutyrate dehydrogenase-like beta-hydroxyacid dehydrogenase
MVGGEAEDFARAKPVFEAMGKMIIHAGPLGDGQMVKLINNAVAASNCAVLAQALVVGARAGVDLEALTQVMGAGSGASTMLDLKARPMREHDYTTLFKLDHMIKDVKLCLEEGEELGAPFPFAALTREIMAAAAGRGYGDEELSPRASSSSPSERVAFASPADISSLNTTDSSCTQRSTTSAPTWCVNPIAPSFPAP